MLHHKRRRHCHSDHCSPSSPLDTPAKDVDEDGIKDRVEPSPDEHRDHRLVGITRSTHDRIEAEAERREDIPRDHDLQIVVGEGERAIVSPQSSEDFVEPNHHRHQGQHLRDQSQQEGITQDTLSLIVLVLAEEDGHTR